MESTQIIELLLGLISFIGAGFIAVILYVYKQARQSLDDNSKLITESNQKNDKAIDALTVKLTEHQTSMGNASKAIHGDMLDIQKNFHGLQTELAKDLIAVKDQMSDLKREAKELVSDLKISTDQFNEKYSRIAEMQEKVNAVEESLAEHDKNILSNREVLESYKKGLEDGKDK